MSTAEQRLRMAKAILDFEARRDKNGHLVVYDLPSNDGGGRYEVAGINERYDREACDKLIAMIRAGKFAEAETFATEYIAGNTDPAARLTNIPSIESYLRDSVFNRGAKGATLILQRALGVADDGEIGPDTVAARVKAEKDPRGLLLKLRSARESYEREVVGYRANFWKGLVNRWDNALKVAQSFPDTPDNKPAAPEPSGVPPWLATMRAITGTKEFPGAADNPVIMKWRDEIAARFPDMANYCKEYTHDSIAWCGLTVGYCMAVNGIRPVFGPAATDKFLWADAWRKPYWKMTVLDKPKLGCVMVFTRNGGGHVALLEGEQGDSYLIRGGNQSEAVSVMAMSKSKFTAALWPKVEQPIVNKTNTTAGAGATAVGFGFLTWLGVHWIDAAMIAVTAGIVVAAIIHFVRKKGS